MQPQSIADFVRRAPLEKRSESRPGHCLWPQDWPQLAGSVTAGASRPMTSVGGSSYFGIYHALR